MEVRHVGSSEGLSTLVSTGPAVLFGSRGLQSQCRYGEIPVLTLKILKQPAL